MSIDLKKLISNVLEEGFMEVPKHVLQPIVDFYLDKLKEFRSSGRTKSSKKFGRGEFKLDFKGTRFENINPFTNKLTVQLSNGDKSWASGDASGYVQLDFSDPLRAVTEVIEHEILHIMQMANNKRINKKGVDTGLPKKKFIKREEHPNPSSIHPSNSSSLYKITKHQPTSYHGHTVGKRRVPFAKKTQPYNWGSKRTEHHRRPIELYPDLLSTIRNLQSAFHNVIEKNQEITDKKEFYNSTHNRKKYFEAFVKGIKEIAIRTPTQNAPILLRVYAAPVGGDLWKNFKKDLTDNLYKYFLKIFYDAFVNRQAPYDYDEIKKKLQDISQAGTEYKQKEQERLESGKINPKDFKFQKEPLAVEAPYTTDYLPDMDDIIPDMLDNHPAFSGATIEGADNILWAFQPIETTLDDMGRSVITTKLQQILKAFNSIGKQRKDDIEELKKFSSLKDAMDADSHALPAEFYDRLKESLKERYLKALLNPNLRNKLSDYIDLEYNAGKG